MFNSFFNAIRAQASNDIDTTRRSEMRREADRCIAFMDGSSFPIENWSFGGVLISADDRRFANDQPVDMSLKFKLRNTIIDIPVRGKIVRKSSGRVAVKFDGVAQASRRHLQQVVDDQVATEFAESQA